MYVAKVNGYRITTLEYRAELERVKEQLHLQQPTHDAKQRALEQLIDACLLLNEAQECDIEIENDDIDHCVVDVMLKFNNEDEFREMLHVHNLSLDDLRKKIKKDLLIKAFIKEQFPPKDSVSTSKLQELYLQNKDAFVTQEKVRASHILIRGVTDESKAKALKMRSELKGAEDFLHHVNHCSECPSSCNCGDLGFFTRGKMVKEFEDVAFELDVNEISQPVKTEFGYHIIMVTEKKASHLATFDDVKEALTNRLRQIDSELQLIRYLKKLRASATIEVFEEKL